MSIIIEVGGVIVKKTEAARKNKKLSLQDKIRRTG